MSEVPPEPEDAPRGREIVLVVDDSPSTLSLITDALESAGMTVLIANGGEEALAVASRITPDVILMDALMPGLDGFETTRRLKAGELASVPVIFMTGLSETEHVVRALKAGGVDYVTKPIAPDEVLARMRVHLANARLTRSAQRALDTTGRFLLAVDDSGWILWSTPRASELLGSEISGRLPEAALPWLAEAVSQGDRGSPILPQRDGGTLRLLFLGRTGTEILLRLITDEAHSQIETMKRRFGLTQREAEVLVWIARGKPNRDIGDILGLSPRTVNKHLEQIYAKLGVENRASAATLAVKASDS